ncbi:succinyldiaminopimelate transaminase [Streptomyces sp. NPDC093085]|uniref:succinyldiaminopimelate transaminase n=1 Tax=Streptomyces sp. NPDC093085 TaxID=3155068 RepID=UPI0034350CA6
MSAVSSRLPVFPWDKLEPYKATAQAHPDGIVDLSVGTPVDPVPERIQRALTGAANSPGYPTVWGTAELRDALTGWVERRLGARGVSHRNVLPVVGSKELVAWLPTQLGLGPGDRVGYPLLAYPTYEVGARLCGAEPVPYEDPTELDPAGLKLLWLNSPSNPTGRVLPPEELTRIVAWAREHGVLLFSDECYLELGWEAEPVSVLHPDVCGGTYEGLVAVHSLSKRSNLAGYRAAFLAGDAAVLGELLKIRKHGGMMVPAPVQAATAVALGDDTHVREQRERYAARRTALRAALEAHGFRVDHSEASLYLWSTRDEPCWETVAHLAELGILVAPGDFYGPAGGRHVRVALTATDERIDAAVKRLG